MLVVLQWCCNWVINYVLILIIGIFSSNDKCNSNYVHIHVMIIVITSWFGDSNVNDNG